MEDYTLSDDGLVTVCLHSKFGNSHRTHSQIKELPKVKLEVLELLHAKKIRLRVRIDAIKDHEPMEIHEQVWIDGKLGAGTSASNNSQVLEKRINKFLTDGQMLDYVLLLAIQKKVKIVFLVLYEEIEAKLSKEIAKMKGAGFEKCKSQFESYLSSYTFPAFLDWSHLQK